MSEGVSEAVGMSSGCLRFTTDVVNHLFAVAFGCGLHDKLTS